MTVQELRERLAKCADNAPVYIVPDPMEPEFWPLIAVDDNEDGVLLFRALDDGVMGATP